MSIGAVIALGGLAWLLAAILLALFLGRVIRLRDEQCPVETKTKARTSDDACRKATAAPGDRSERRHHSSCAGRPPGARVERERAQPEGRGGASGPSGPA
jgi:hypothetical protein